VKEEISMTQTTINSDSSRLIPRLFCLIACGGCLLIGMAIGGLAGINGALHGIETAHHMKDQTP
jgi:hypothetical protein